MEWALAIPRLQTSTRLKDLWSGPKGSLLNDLKKDFEDRFGFIRFTRLYYGQEFCEKAISGKEDMKKALYLSEEEGMNFTCVTPYVTEKGLTKVKVLLSQLAKERPESEVVINDWGVLDWIIEEQLTLTPILGRLLNKVLRDPRIPKNLMNSSNSEKTHYFQTSCLAGLGMKNLLDQYSVKRIELDHPPQGLDPELLDWGYQTSLYLPFGVVTTGRLCLIQSWGVEVKDKFRSSSRCDQKCLPYWLEMTDLSGRVRKNADWKLMQKGNTIFYRLSRESVAKAIDSADSTGVNRIVFQPEPL